MRQLPPTAVDRRSSFLDDDTRSRLATIMDNPLFQRFCDVVAVGVADVYVVPSALPLQDGGQQWRKFATRRRIDPPTALATHLLAGELDSAVGLDGYNKDAVCVVGFSYRADAVVPYVSLDLDGTAQGYVPTEIFARLNEHFGPGRFLAHSGSGRPGRIRCSALVPEMPLGQLTTSMTAVVTALGYRPQKGGLEIFPATGNGRLPFGLGGRTVFRGPDLEPDELNYQWTALVEWLLDGVPLDFTRRPKARARTTRVADLAPPKKPPKKVASPTRAWADPWSQVARWWKDGVEKHERDTALFALVRDCRRRSLGEEEAVNKLKKWIGAGGLARSSIGSDRRALAWECNVHVPDIARRVYAHPRPRLKPVHLTAREIAAAVALADQRCPDNAREAVLLLLAILPWFKSAWLVGLDGVQLHSKLWASLLNRREGYPRIRAELRLFVRGRNYVAGEQSITWHLFSPSAFAFDRVKPRGRQFKTKGRPALHIMADARDVAAKEERRAVREQRRAVATTSAEGTIGEPSP
jgi:hypothetical protein